MTCCGRVQGGDCGSVAEPADSHERLDKDDNKEDVADMDVRLLLIASLCLIIYGPALQAIAIINKDICFIEVYVRTTG